MRACRTAIKADKKNNEKNPPGPPLREREENGKTPYIPNTTATRIDDDESGRSRAHRAVADDTKAVHGVPRAVCSTGRRARNTLLGSATNGMRNENGVADNE